MSIEVNATEQIIEVNATGSTIDIDVTNQIVDVNATTTVIDVTASNNPGGVVPVGGNTGQVLKKFSNNDYDTYWAADASGLTSVGLSMPSGFVVSNSPLTSNGTLTVTGAGTSAQYIDGTGAIQNFPTLTNSDKVIKEVYNETGATLPKGTVVYINGSHGNLPTIAKALATSDATSAQTLGLVQTDITNMHNGYIVIIGNIIDIDTQAFANGTQLYLSGSVAGEYTSVKPYAPIHLVYVGIVVRSHPIQGIISVKVQNGYEMDELHNVDAQSPSNNDGLFYNTTTSLWEHKQIATALGYTPVTNARTLTINGTSYDLSANRSWTIASGNIYNTDGTLTGNRTITNNAYTLTIVNASNTSAALIVQNTQPYGTGSVYTQYGQQWLSPTGTVQGYTRADGRLYFDSIQSTQFSVGSIAGIIDAGVSRGGSIGINGAPIDFGTATYAGGGTNIGRWFSTGNLVIQTGGVFADAGYKLDVQGTGRFTGQVTAPSLYSSLSYLYLGTTAGTTHNITDDIQRVKSNSGFLIYQFGGSGLSLGSYGAYWDNTNYRLSITAASTERMFFHGSSLNITVGTATDLASSLFTINSTTKGFLPPRMTTTERNAISTPATGLSVYNTTTNTNDYYNGSAWVSQAAGNIYTADGTLTGNRTVTMGSNTLSFSGNISVNGLTVGKGTNNILTNTAVGIDTLPAVTTGFQNTAFGYQVARFLTSGTYNAAFGLQTLYTLTTGVGNSAFGYSCLYSNNGSRNSAFGSASFYSLSSGNDNTAFGGNAGRYIADGVTANTIANTSIFIGQDTKALANNQSNQIVIGYNATGLGSNTTVIGNSSTTDTAIYGRMLVNYSTPVIGTYALDVQGTGRFTGQVNGDSFQGLNTASRGGFISNYATASYLILGQWFGNSGSTRKNAIISRTTDYGVTNANLLNLFADNTFQFDDASAYAGAPNQTSASAFVEIKSTTKGFLPPRMTETQKNAISTPATGLVIYQTDGTEGLYQYKSTGWAALAGGGGSGTVTSVSVVSANGFAGTVATSTSTPAITLSTTVTGLIKGNGTALSAAVAGTDYQSPISLTTTGSSGASTFISNTLNIPQYTLSGLGGQPLSTNLTSLDGLSYVSDSFVKMTAAGTFTLDTNSYYLASNPSGYTSNTGTVTTVSVVSANGFAGTVANAGTTPAITISTSITGLLKGNGTSISAATANTDYLAVNNPAFTGVLTSGTLTYTPTNHIASLQSSVNAYNQFVIQNSNAGATASSDVVVNNNQSTDTTFYGDFGINSSAFSGTGSLSLPNATYLASSDGDLVLGTYTSNLIRFVVNSGATDAMAISTTGNVRINLATDAGYKLDVGGLIRSQGHLLTAGTASLAPLSFTPTSAALKTTPAAGDFEVDANGNSYYTIQASNRGVVHTEQFITLTAAYTTPTGTAGTLKQLFNSTTNGALTVSGSTTYFFECYFTLSSMSATSGTFSFGLAGTATYSSVAYYSQGLKSAITNATPVMSNQTSAAAQVVGSNAGNTTTTGFAYIKGKIVISTGGTIIPSFALSVAAAAVVGNNSYFRLTPVGTNTVTNIGNWS